MCLITRGRVFSLVYHTDRALGAGTGLRVKQRPLASGTCAGAGPPRSGGRAPHHKTPGPEAAPTRASLHPSPCGACAGLVVVA